MHEKGKAVFYAIKCINFSNDTNHPQKLLYISTV